MLASSYGHKDVLKYLVKQGANVDMQTKVQSFDMDITCIWIYCTNEIGLMYALGWIHSIDTCITRGSYGYSAIFS